MKAVVIGAGVVGSAVAWRLAEAGADVVIIEAGYAGGGTSGASFAWTNASNKPPREYHDLNTAGMRAHAALEQELGAAPWLHRSGCVEWCATPEAQEAQRQKIERLKSWDYAAGYITRDELGRLEPDIDPGSVGDAPIAFYPDDGWIDPAIYINTMLRRALSLGASLLTGTRVVDVLTRNGAVCGVRTADGAVHAADMVVNCAGRWADCIAEDPALRIPLAPTTGFLVVTPPVATSISRVIFSPEIHLRPDGGGRLMLRRNEFDGQVTPDTAAGPAMPQAQEVMRRVAQIIPALKGVPPEAARIAVRPIPRDGLSAVGPMPGTGNYYVVVTHSGVTLSPYLARAVADEIVRGTPHPELDSFRPARFFN